MAVQGEELAVGKQAAAKVRSESDFEAVIFQILRHLQGWTENRFHQYRDPLGAGRCRVGVASVGAVGGLGREYDTGGRDGHQSPRSGLEEASGSHQWSLFRLTENPPVLRVRASMGLFAIKPPKIPLWGIQRGSFWRF